MSDSHLGGNEWQPPDTLPFDPIYILALCRWVLRQLAVFVDAAEGEILSSLSEEEVRVGSSASARLVDF